MQSLKKIMAKKGRVCAKVNGKQRCTDCKDFTREKNRSEVQQATYEMMFDDPQYWFDTYRVDGIGQRASSKTYKP